MKGPDGASSWVIAGACCFINLTLFGMARLSGVLFVASVPRFGVSREEASFPYTFANFIRNTASPLIGYLGHHLGVRLVTTFGCLLAAIGVGTCFFAESISTITVLWGFLFGLGFGLGNMLLPVKINQYFDKYRATASGIAFSGACLGSFILPSVVEILTDTYGLSGSFLIMAGLVLNCVPAALLLRKPDFQLQPSKSKRRESDTEKQSITSGKKVKLYTVDDTSSTMSALKAKSAEAMQKFQYPEPPMSNLPLTYDEKVKRLSTQTLLSNYSIRMSSPDPLDFEQIMENSKGRRQVYPNALDCEIGSVASNTSDPDKMAGSKVAKEMYSSMPRTLSDGSVMPLSSFNLEGRHSKSFNDLYTNNAYQRDDYVRKGSCQASVSCASTVKNESAIDSFSIIFDPIFVLIAITNSLYSFTFVCMITVIVDFAKDIEVGESNEKFILMSLSVGDLIGRLGLGWVTDDGYMTLPGFAALCFLCQGVTTASIAWSTGFPMLVSLAALYGLSEAGLILIFPLIVAEYIEEEKQTVAISSAHFLAGPLCLTVAPLIGYFRDDIGSYAYIFFGIGVISLACCFAWLLTPCILRCRKNTRD